MRVRSGVNTAFLVARFRQALLRAIAFAAAALVVIGLVGRDDFFVGTMWALARWPLLAVLVASILVARRRALAVPAALLVCAGLVEWGTVRARRAEPQPAAEAPSEKLEVLTFNLLFRGGKPAQSEKVLRATDADVIALQEVTEAWQARLAEPLAERYPHQSWKPHRGTHGFALLSKHPLGEPVELENEDGRTIARCAEVRVPAKPVWLCNVHLSSPAKALWNRSPGAFARNAERRAREWAKLSALVERHATSPRRMIVGDLNTMPQDPLHRTITRRWVDSWEWASEGLLGATWPNLNDKTPVPLFRIDYVLVQGPVVPESMTVLENGGSDHRPVRAHVRL